MSRDLAMKVGSCVDPTKHGDACPPEQRTIFVGIASYRDFQCRLTVESIFTRAKHPERIRVGIVDQIVNGEDPLCNEPVKPCTDDPAQALCKYIQQVDVYEMAAELSIGPVFARHIGYRMYRGEYYATQSDAHVSYTAGWDEDIIRQMESTHNEMAVLSTYLTDVQDSISAEGHSLRNTRPIMCNTDYEGGPQGLHLRHGSQPERMPAVHNVPQLQPWWAAGYSFSRGHFIVNVPYDWLQPMIFQGEEMSIGIRGFTVGYDFYAPERSVCFHHYAVGRNAAVRNKVHHFWENDEKYAGTGRAAMARLLGMVHMNPEVPSTTWDHAEEATYGIGGVRTPEKFYETFGIDVKKKTVEGNLCSFVHEGGKMHKLFTPLLRSDGMGIDYSTILYRFVDPAKK
jgi:[Skp1-protein]-hydroxyproline N-acetylglucosaminyltransferase